MLRCFSISFVHKLYRQEIIKRACFKRGWAPNPAVKCPPALLHQPEPNSRYMLQRNRKWYKTVLHNVLSDGSLCKWLESSIKSQINVIIKHQHINLDVSRALFFINRVTQLRARLVRGKWTLVDWKPQPQSWRDTFCLCSHSVLTSLFFFLSFFNNTGGKDNNKNKEKKICAHDCRNFIE